MFPLALVVFRDVFELMLFIGILATALRQEPNRQKLLTSGIVLGLLGALALALGSGALKNSLSGTGEDVFHVVVLSVVFAMLVWHIVWASQHAREMVSEAKQLGQSVNSGSSSTIAVVIAMAMVTLREGSEVALYLFSLSSDNEFQLSGAEMVMSSLAGVAAGVVLGYLIYQGFSRFSIKKMFQVTNVFVALMAAGIATRLAEHLAGAGFIPTGADPLWDSSAWLSEDGALGLFLHALTGYVEKPLGAQVLAFVLALALIVGLLAWQGRTRMVPSLASKSAK